MRASRSTTTAGSCWRVLATRNGVAVDGQPHAAGDSVVLPDAGATLQLGTTRLRLRLPGETLAPERAIVAPRRIAGAVGAGAGGDDGRHRLDRLDPGADLTAWLPLLVGVPVALAGVVRRLGDDVQAVPAPLRLRRPPAHRAAVAAS